MGLPVIISILFFLIYHISSITGEKSALQGVISVNIGMWISSFILTPLGIFLTINASNDSSFFQTSFYRKLLFRFNRLWVKRKF